MAEEALGFTLATKQTTGEVLDVTETSKHGTERCCKISNASQGLSATGIVAKYDEKIKNVVSLLADKWSGALRGIDTIEDWVGLAHAGHSFRSAPRQPRRYTHVLKEQKVFWQLNAEVVKPASFHWTSPILVSPENVRPFCSCTDYSHLSKAMIKNMYAIFRFDKCNDSSRSERISAR